MTFLRDEMAREDMDFEYHLTGYCHGYTADEINLWMFGA